MRYTGFMGKQHLLDHLASVTGKQPAQVAIDLLPQLLASLDKAWVDNRVVSPAPIVRTPVIGLATANKGYRVSIHDLQYAFHTWADCTIVQIDHVRAVRVSVRALFFVVLIPSVFADVLPPQFEVTDPDTGRLVLVTTEEIR